MGLKDGKNEFKNGSETHLSHHSKTHFWNPSFHNPSLICKMGCRPQTLIPASSSGAQTRFPLSSFCAKVSFSRITPPRNFERPSVLYIIWRSFWRDSGVFSTLIPARRAPMTGIPSSDAKIPCWFQLTPERIWLIDVSRGPSFYNFSTLTLEKWQTTQ